MRNADDMPCARHIPAEKASGSGEARPAHPADKQDPPYYKRFIPSFPPGDLDDLIFHDTYNLRHSER